MEAGGVNEEERRTLAGPVPHGDLLAVDGK